MLGEYHIADLKGSVGRKNQPHMTQVQFRECNCILAWSIL